VVYIKEYRQLGKNVAKFKSLTTMDSKQYKVKPEGLLFGDNKKRAVWRVF
jgi:hypothetical protein